MQKIYKEILVFFPDNLKEIKEINNELIWNLAEEIRIRIGRQIIIKLMNDEIFIGDEITNEDMIRLIENFCNNSIYSMQNEINSGYLTLKGGHRVGISGTSVFQNNEIRNIKYISSLNIRIAREIKGCSEKILKNILKNNKFENTLIVSPPGCGKTTILRDMIRNLSNGFKEFKGKNISLVDERSEIAAMYKGIPQNDIGIRTDVMCNLKKSIGIKMMIRSMGPEIIATDEVGTNSDFESIYDAICSGVKLLLTVHGNDIEDISKKFVNEYMFKNIIILTKKERPGEVKKIYKLEDKKYVLNS
jgi:stage III sporulation protein AA